MPLEDTELISAKHFHDATITIRVIKSFPHRTIKNMILRNVDLSKINAQELLEQVNKNIQTQGAFRPYRTCQLDTFKIYTHAHLTKTMNLAINLDHDEWIIDDMSKPLAEYGIMNESEVSLFNRQQFDEFKANPTEIWEC